MFGFYDYHGGFFCSIECYRRYHGVNADPYRMAMHHEVGTCTHCGYDTAKDM